MNPVRSYNTLYVAGHAVTIIALIGILISIPSYAYTLGDHQEGVNSATRYTSSPTSLLTQSAILSSPVPMQSGGGLRRSEEHTSELQSRGHLVCRLLLEKKKISYNKDTRSVCR